MKFLISSLFAFSFYLSFCVGLKDDVDKFLLSWGNPQFPVAKPFDPLPQTQEEAMKQGWKAAGNGCKESTFYKGSRFILNGDPGVLIIYDANGYVAGVHTALPKDAADSTQVGYDKRRTVHAETINGGGYYTMAVYFVDPSTICTGRSEEEFKSQGPIPYIYIDNGNGEFLSPPMNEDKELLAKQNWVFGNCLVTMGDHYYYKLAYNMSCKNFYQVTVSYDGLSETKPLVASAFMFFGNFSSPRYEHIGKSFLPLFSNPLPKCMSDYFDKAGGVTGLHVYRTSNHSGITCPK